MKYRLPLVSISAIALLSLSLLLMAGSTEAAEWGVDLALVGPDDVRTYEPPDPVEINLTVEHTGTALTQVVIVDLLSEPPGWSHNLLVDTQGGATSGTDDVTFELAVGEVANLSVTIVPTAGTANDTYWLTVRARVEEDLGVSDTVDIGVTIPKLVDFEVRPWNPPDGGVHKAVPPATVTMQFAVYNKGNARDRFRVSVTSALVDEGWVPVMTSGVDGLGWTPDMDPDPAMGNPNIVTVEVQLPEDAVAGTQGRVTVNVRSWADPSVVRPPAVASVRALQYHEFGVSVDGEDRKEGRLGETVDFQMRIHNQGNGVDTFRIFAAWNEENAPGWVARPEPSEVTIEAMTNDTIRFRVKVPMNASLGTFTFHAEVWSSNTELTPVSKTFEVDVARSYGMSVWAERTELTAAPGERVYFQVLVRNTGNSIDSYNISFVDWNGSWVHFISPYSLTLFPGEDGPVNVTVLVPADLGSSPLPSYTFDLLVESVAGDTERLLALKIDIDQFGRVEWLWEGDAVTSPGDPVASNGTLRPRPVIDVYSGTTLALNLQLRNAGVIEDNVTVWAWSPDPRVNVTVQPGWKKLRIGGTLDVYVLVSVPDNMTPGEHRLWLNASSSDGRQPVRAVPVEFDLIPYFDSIDFAGLSWDDPLGDDFAFTYRLESDRVASSRGRRARHADLDLLTLTAVLDPETNQVTLTMELKGAPTEDKGVFYGFYIVNEDHRVVGGLVDPRSHEVGDFVWESHDDANTIANIYVSDGQLGSSVPMLSLRVTHGSDRVVFHVHAKDLRKAGVEPGSDFRIYGYCHRLGPPGDGGGGSHLVYDTAGQGAVTGPWEFTDVPEETSYMGWVVVAVVVVAVMAILAVLYVIPRMMPPVPEEGPGEADEWEEFD